MYPTIKRIFDVIFALLLLVPLMPIMLIIALAVKIESKGPAIFVQERLGRDGHVFNIYKFRSMVDNAINIGDGLHMTESDFRITKVGRFLRKTSLDELPQLINILSGQMSFIGPRPPVPYFPRDYKEYSAHQKRRFELRPGITGYAQVMGRNDISWDERIEYDIIYYKDMSVFFDIKILFKTVSVVFASEGIYGGETDDK